MIYYYQTNSDHLIFFLYYNYNPKKNFNTNQKRDFVRLFNMSMIPDYENGIDTPYEPLY